ncbi:MAG: CopG family transcriptional regulator [Elusimicrobiota bacterium]
MKRTTIMVPEDLRSRVLRRARERGISFGEMVRESLSAALEVPGKKRAQDTLLADTAVYKGAAPGDLSLRHDDHLYGEER